MNNYRRLLSLGLFLTLPFLIWSQDTLDVKFYKEPYRSKKTVKKKKATHSYFKFANGDTICEVFKDIRSNGVLSSEKRLGNKKVGHWIVRNPYGGNSTDVHYGFLELDSVTEIIFKSGMTVEQKDESLTPPTIADCETASNGLNCMFPILTYPEISTETGGQGIVEVQVHFSDSGEVLSVRIKGTCDKYIDSEIVNALENVERFHPAKRNGVPIESVCYYEINFTLK